MKNFEHYEEQIKGFEQDVDCHMHELMIGKPNVCSCKCGECFIKTFNWLNEEYQEPKVVLPKKLAIVLSDLLEVDSFKVKSSLSIDVSKIYLYINDTCISIITYERERLDIGNLECGKKYYLKDCDFTKGE